MTFSCPIIPALTLLTEKTLNIYAINRVACPVALPGRIILHYLPNEVVLLRK